jgi:hypothetical protein
MISAQGNPGVRQGLFLWLAALALAIRVLVPAGYMPSDGKGLEITLCTGDGMVSAWVDEQGNLHKGEKAPDGKGDHPCAFAGVGALAEADSPADAINLPALSSSVQPIRSDHAFLGRGLAAPPPPQTGPPLFA